MLSIEKIRVNHMEKPLGLDDRNPVFSWRIESDVPDTVQTRYRITVSSPKEIVWENSAESRSSAAVPYAGKALESRERYHVTVTVEDNHGVSCTGETDFEMGLFREDWKAKWVEAEHKTSQGPHLRLLQSPSKEMLESIEETMSAPTVFSSSFSLKGEICRARLYLTAHGTYRFSVNGSLCSDRYFAPEFTPYDKLLYFQTYDVTDALRFGENLLEVTVADGWYAGYIGLTAETGSYGTKHALLWQLEVCYEDGSAETFVSDASTRAGEGRIEYGDLYIGEKRDFTKAAVERALPVHIAPYGIDTLAAQDREPVRCWREVPAAKLFRDSEGSLLVDFGQVLAGFVRFSVQGQRGQQVVLEHSEVLDQNGAFLMNILGVARQRDVYVLDGTQQTIEPEFTYHGFRYVRLTGFPETCSASDFTAVALSSDTGILCELETDNEKLNRLWQNTIWSQRANMISIPTDCPQREKAGWTGDIQVYGATAVQNSHMGAFLSSWLRSARLEQLETGQIPMIVPYVKSYQELGKPLNHRSACWGDVIEVLPWRLYHAYGDPRVLEENLAAIERWTDFARQEAQTKSALGYRLNPRYWFSKKAKEQQKLLWNNGLHFGDWLVPSLCGKSAAIGFLSMLTKTLVAPCYYLYNLEVTAKIYEALGRMEKAQEKRAEAERVREAFRFFHVRKDGTIHTRYQGVLVLALYLDIIPANKKKNAVDQLVRMIDDNGGCLDTGFASIEFLMDVLCANGRSDVAYRLLYQNKCPSWMYEIDRGATTLWESWRAIMPDGTVTSVSYNHYCFGCVDDWIYRWIVGLNAVEPGYQRIRIQPHPDCGLNRVRYSYDSACGRIGICWEKQEEAFSLRLSIPANVTAEVILPDGSARTLGSGAHELKCSV